MSPQTAHGWLQPTDSAEAEPRWGHPAGLQVGLPPLPGPRGLFRVYTPYLNQAPDRLLNFVAVEPIPAGADERGYSELEHSAADGVRGKRLTALDRGVVDEVDGVERLTVLVVVERFDNGAEVAVRIRFRSDRPHEVGLAAFRAAGSVQLATCVLSATMGNFARLRRLELADGVVSPEQLWPGFDGEHFTDHAGFGLDRLVRTADGDALVATTPDELDPTTAEHAEGTAEHWRYVGDPARQIWRAPEPDPQLRAQVNGRHCYWMSDRAIPGGTAYENVELVEPFRDGREIFFAVEPVSPASP